MNKRIALGALSALSLIYGSANAAEEDPAAPGWYLGVGAGKSTIKVSEVGFDESDTAYKVFGGFSFNQYFALEAAYVDSGNPSMAIGTATVDAGITGLNMSLVGRIPIGDSFALFGKLGFATYSGEVNARRNGTILLSEDGSDSDMSYGFGASFTIGKRFVLGAEYEVIDITDLDYSSIMVTGAIKF
jgi:OOP family OmpA-OmpF porin